MIEIVDRDTAILIEDKIETPKRNGYVMIVDDNGARSIKKILYVSQNRIQWRGGECRICDLERNPNRKNNAKFIIKKDKVQ